MWNDILRGIAIVTIALVAPLVQTGAASASPSIIRLGYPTCAVCHLSPQGRGLLTEYGKGIDEAESLRGAAYESDRQHRRLVHDLRLLMQLDHAPPPGESRRDWLPTARVSYRNATLLSTHHRVSATVSLDLPNRALAGSPIQPASDLPRVYVSHAMWEYRPRPGLELAVGRDVLPGGLEIADQSSYMRARNAQGFADVATQAKLFWWSSRFQVTSYAFGPSGFGPSTSRSSGGGVLTEIITGRERVVIGISARASRNRTFDERLLGMYARTGFGRWAFLSEWDYTVRRRDGIDMQIDQVTGFGQVLFYPTRWLITSLAAERLRIGDPYMERGVRFRPEVSARLSSHVTAAASVRDQWVSSQRVSPTFLLQIYIKTVQ
jgi:hypothetical protein